MTFTSSFRRDAETNTRGRVRYPELAPIRTFLIEPVLNSMAVGDALG
jgi:hypothetical protein